jgi:hypothetical protein
MTSPHGPRRVRTYVRPALRRPGSIVIPGWLAVTIGHSIISWRRLDPAELEHELTHVRQWERAGTIGYPIAYALASLRAIRAGGHWYRDNAFEAEAYAAALAVRDGRARAPRIDAAGA